MNGDRTNVGEFYATVKVSGSVDETLNVMKMNLKNALKAMADATLQRATMLAPMSDIEGHAGTLRTSSAVEVENNGNTVKVSFGNGIPYARYQEFGGDGKRVVRNYTTPGTQAHYLRDAFRSVVNEGVNKYL